MTDPLPNVYSPIQRRLILFGFTLALLLILLPIHIDLASAQSFGSIGIRAEIRGLTLHVEWDAAPASLNGQPFLDWSVVIADTSSIIFGCGFRSNLTPCSFGPSTTSKDIDISGRLLGGVAPGLYTLIVHVSADYGTEGKSGLFVGNIPTPPILFENVSGDGQAGKVNSPLKEPFVVRATRMGRAMVDGVFVSWNVIQTPPGASGQRFIEMASFINSQGLSSARLMLGNLEGEYQVQGGPITFTSTAHATKTLKLKALPGGSGRTGRVGEALGSPFGVLVSDADGQPVNDIGISYKIIKQPSGAKAAGPLSVGKTTGRDGVRGEANTTLTLGDKTGAYTIEATCADCTEGSPVTFTATATGPEGCTLNGASIASQVNFASGNLFYTQNLLSLTGTGPQVNFTLAYNSIDASNGSLGAHWTHP